MSESFNWRDAAADQKRREQRGYAFALPNTFPDRPARVRRLPLAQLATIGGLSSAQQDLVLSVFRDLQQGKTFDVHHWKDLERNQMRQEELADAFCIAAFLEPRLVATQEEAEAVNDPAVLWVKAIDIEDRVTFLQAMMDRRSEAAKALAPFPETGSSGSEIREAVANGREEPVEAAAAPQADEAQPVRLSAL